MVKSDGLLLAIGAVILLLALRLVALFVSVEPDLLALNAVGFILLAIRVIVLVLRLYLIVLIALVGELVDERGINSQVVDLEQNS